MAGGDMIATLLEGTKTGEIVWQATRLDPGGKAACWDVRIGNFRFYAQRGDYIWLVPRKGIGTRVATGERAKELVSLITNQFSASKQS